MAFESQITRAAVRDRAPIGADAMHRDAILALPATERAAAVQELARAARAVHKATAGHECAWVCRNPEHDHYGPLALPLCADTVCARVGYPGGSEDADELLAQLGLTPQSAA